MRTFLMHYEQDGRQSFYIASGVDLTEVLSSSKRKMRQLKLDRDLNNCWSEEIYAMRRGTGTGHKVYK